MTEQQMGNMTQYLQETCHTEKPGMGHRWNRILSNSDAIPLHGKRKHTCIQWQYKKIRNYTVVVKS